MKSRKDGHMAQPKHGKSSNKIWGIGDSHRILPSAFPEQLPSDITADRVIVDGVEYVRADQISTLLNEYKIVCEDLYSSQNNPILRIWTYLNQSFLKNTQQINTRLQMMSRGWPGTNGPIPEILWFHKIYKLMNYLFGLDVRTLKTKQNESKLKCLTRHGYLPLVCITTEILCGVIRDGVGSLPKQDSQKFMDNLFKTELTKHNKPKSQNKKTP